MGPSFFGLLILMQNSISEMKSQESDAISWSIFNSLLTLNYTKIVFLFGID